MLRIIRDDKSVSVFDAENKYKNCNILLINPEKTDDTLFGEVYAISDSIDSHNDLLDVESALIDEGIKTIIAGEYKDSLSVDYLKMVRIA